jgi:pyruvate dehydrogenase E2 component (dihydrolipoamide acetyltransferase)
MAREFRLPDLGEGIHEGEIVAILVSAGEEVEEDQPILEVETDKATVEIPSPFGGTVQEIRIQKGDLVHVGDVLFVFDGVESAGAPAEDEAAPQRAGERQVPPPEEEPARGEGPKEPAQPREGPVPASPATRRLARELGVDLQQVPGSGPGGRVTSADVRQFAEREEAVTPPKPEDRPPAPELPPQATGLEGFSPIRASAIPLPPLPDFSRWGEIERLPLRSVRRATAKHMARAWSQIPHVNHQDIADVTELETLRQQHKAEIAEQGGSLTLTVFAMKAVVAALKAHPRFNASLDTDSQEIILKRYYHIGIAVDTERGLLVPVIRDVDRKSIVELSVELKDLVARTRAGEATLEEMQGGTFTITNPGPLGGTAFAPIVNYPEVAILGMAQARWKPVVRGNVVAPGQSPQNEAEVVSPPEIVPRLILPLILAFDHRVVDGADAARFVSRIIDSLEDPGKLLIRI